MSEYYVLVPRVGTNDDYVTIGSWLVKNGDYVKKGQAIASLETTKETEDILADYEGYLFYDTEVGSELKVGERMAVITDDAALKFTVVEKDDRGTQNITNKARELAEKYHIDLQQFKGKDIIREKDILPLIQTSEDKITRSKANDVIIVSGGALKMCIDLLLQNKAYNIHGILDTEKEVGQLVNGVPVLGKPSSLPDLRNEGYLSVMIARGSITIDNQSKQFNMRKELFNMVKSYGFFVPTLIHPTASVAVTAQIGEGTHIFEHATVGSDAVIGDDCLINTGAIVSHDCRISHHVRISPGAILAGNVTVGENTLIGMGTTIYIGVKIGANVIIANGQNIFSDVPAGSVIK